MNVDASQVLNSLKQFQAALPEKVHRAVELACLKVEADAKKNCPVGEDGDAGQLRASISHEVKQTAGKTEGFVGSNLFYAPFVHQGTGLYAIEGNGRKEVPWHYQTADGKWHETSGMEPTPFLQDAIDSNKAAIENHFKEVLKL